MTCLTETWAMLNAIPEVRQIEKTLQELDNPVKEVLFYCDNKGTVDIFKSNKITPVVKKLDLRDVEIRQFFVSNKRYKILYVKSEDNIADLFTKNLPITSFLKFRKKLIE